MRTWKSFIMLLCLSVGLSLAACDGGSGGGESGPGEDTPPGEDTLVQGDAPFGSCDSQGLSHTCTEYYGAEEFKDTILYT